MTQKGPHERVNISSQNEIFISQQTALMTPNIEGEIPPQTPP